MGTNQSKKPEFDANCEVNFDHFQILRAIGKGSFGKVCIVQKRDTKQMYAMKYMNKNACVLKDAVRNVLREVELLKCLNHPFLVNIWFAFQDEEDMFMVVDLLLGGDLRYHIQKDVKFEDDVVFLYIAEIGLALDYMRSKNVIHRDIKPDNILLDEEGHVHITDFNIATEIRENRPAQSVSGTKPYMAPEIYACAVEQNNGYSYPVDWWSLGILAYEMLRGKLLNLCAEKRISSLEQLKPLVPLDFNAVYHRKVKPTYLPAKDHLNCDPTYELEEMIIEAKPLHKKKKRLAKQNSKRENAPPSSTTDQDPMTVCLEKLEKDFKTYDRERDKTRCANGKETTTAAPKSTENSILASSLASLSHSQTADEITDVRTPT